MVVGRFLQNSDTFGALIALGLLGWSLNRPSAPEPVRKRPARPRREAQPTGLGHSAESMPGST
jgi:hypothetical protein